MLHVDSFWRFPMPTNTTLSHTCISVLLLYQHDDLLGDFVIISRNVLLFLTHLMCSRHSISERLRTYSRYQPGSVKFILFCTYSCIRSIFSLQFWGYILHIFLFIYLFIYYYYYYYFFFFYYYFFFFGGGGGIHCLTHPYPSMSSVFFFFVF